MRLSSAPPRRPSHARPRLAPARVPVRALGRDVLFHRGCQPGGAAVHAGAGPRGDRRAGAGAARVPVRVTACPSTLAAWQPFVVQAIINNVIPFTLMVYGQQRIASGLAAVLNATTPLFTLIVARVLAGETLTRARCGRAARRWRRRRAGGAGSAGRQRLERDRHALHPGRRVVLCASRRCGCGGCGTSRRWSPRPRSSPARP